MKNDHLIINKLLKPIKKSILPGHPLVLVDEEFGYGQMFWFPRLPKNEVIKWWKHQPYMGLEKYIHLTKIGEVVRTFEHINILSDPEVSEEYDALEVHRTDIKMNTWDKIKNHCKLDSIWYAHVFNDCNTWLKCNKNRYIHHSGYWKAKIEDDIACLKIDIPEIELEFYDKNSQ